MGKRITYEKVVNFFYQCTDLILVSILWMIGCIPIVTSGASTVALYYTVNKCIRHGRGKTWSCFWQSFRQNLKQSVLITLGFLAAVVVFATDYRYMNTLGETSSGYANFAIFFEVLIFLLCIYAFWVFAHIARFEGTIKVHLKNAFLFAILHLHITIAVAVIGMGSVMLIMAVWPVLFIVPGLSVFCMNLFTEKVFRKYMREEDKAMEDELNLDYRDDYVGKGLEQMREQRRERQRRRKKSKKRVE